MSKHERNIKKILYRIKKESVIILLTLFAMSIVFIIGSAAGPPDKCGDSSDKVPDSITGLHNTTFEPNHIKWEWTWECKEPGARVLVYIEAKFRKIVPYPKKFYSVNNLTPDTEYTISTHTIKGKTVNQTWVNHTARTAPGEYIPPLSNGPNITTFSPTDSVVYSIVGDKVIFSVTSNQTVDVIWEINGNIVDSNIDATQSVYVATGISEETRTVTVSIGNDNGEDSHIWTWIVTASESPTPTPTTTPIPTPTPTPTASPTPTPTPTPTASPTPTPTPTPTASPTPIPKYAGSSDSGGNNGGYESGGTIIGIPSTFEEREGDLKAGVPVTYSFTTDDLAIYQIVVTGKENEYDVDMRVAKVRDRSKFTAADAPEIVYTNESILAGSQRLSNILIRFRVKNTWIDNNYVGVHNIQLYKLVNSSIWELLETVVKNKDDKYTYFESNDSSVARFTVFVISGEKKVPELMASEVDLQSLPLTDATIANEKKTGNYMWSILVAVVLLSALTYYAYRRKTNVGKKRED